MQSSRSFFNGTVFRKNLTRFAPIWGLYTLCLMMGMLLMTAGGTNYWFVANTAECIQVMVAVNFGYAVIVAALLFGDLYKTRMCYSLHAMPLRREGWFLTNLVSGLLFSLVPTLLMTVPSVALASMAKFMPGSWQIPLYWLLGTNLSYLFFFGLACLCAFLVGTRVGLALVYGIGNILSLIAYTLVDTLYTPALYGVETWFAPFRFLCPLVAMADTTYIDINRHTVSDWGWTTEVIMGDWSYLVGCAVLGILLMGAALLVYRRRNLENAGEIIAVKALKPIFLVVYTLCAGVVFFYGTEIFLGTQNVLQIIFLALGVLAGWFTGQMLLQRTVRVFRKGTFAGFGILLAVLLASLGLNALDPFRIAAWTPEPQEVTAVTLTTGHYRTEKLGDRSIGNRNTVVLQEEEDILQIIRLQNLDREHYRSHGAENCPHESYTINYHMADGTTRTRYYGWDGKPGEMETILRGYFSQVECLFGIPSQKLTELASYVKYVNLDGEVVPVRLTEQDYLELLEAIQADCAEGNMAYRECFHYNCATGGGGLQLYPESVDYYYTDYYYYDEEAYWNLRLDVWYEPVAHLFPASEAPDSVSTRPEAYDPLLYPDPSIYYSTKSFSLWVRDCCTHTVQWFEDHSLMHYRTESEKNAK